MYQIVPAHIIHIPIAYEPELGVFLKWKPKEKLPLGRTKRRHVNRLYCGLVPTPTFDRMYFYVIYQYLYTTMLKGERRLEYDIWPRLYLYTVNATISENLVKLLEGLSLSKIIIIFIYLSTLLCCGPGG